MTARQEKKSLGWEMSCNLITDLWGARICFVVLLILGMSTTISKADCSYAGVWSGSWYSGIDPESGDLNFTVSCDGYVSGTMKWVIPDPGCTLYFNFNKQVTELNISFCFQVTDYCYGIPVTLNICVVGDCDGCDTLTGTYSGESYAGGEGPFTESGTWIMNRTSPPEKAFNPNPPNEATGQSINVNTSWSNCGACTFDVYFGECGSMVKVSDNQDETTFEPGTLSYATDYCWRIDSKNTNGTTTGNDWYFTTGVNPNQSPVIESVSALPSYILDNQTSLLEVVASDSDGPSPLSYNWIIQPGEGSLDDYNSATPVYTPPDITSSQQTFTITVDVNDGSNTSSSSVDINVIDINSITCDFYQDDFIDFLDFAILADYFAGSNCTEPNWCQGTDFDHSGSIDILELTIFIERWLSEVTDPDLLAHWPLDDNDSNTFVSDISGNGHNGIASANTELLSAPGIVNTCFDLGGANAVVITDDGGVLGDALSFDDSGDNPFTIAAWIYVTTTGNAQMILSKWDETSTAQDREWAFHLRADKTVKFIITDEDAVAQDEMKIITDDPLSDGWHFLVGTYDSSGGATASDGLKIYVDGALVDSTAYYNADYTQMRAGATDVVIGAYYNGLGNLALFFADKIDNVILFGTDLTAANILNLYDEGLD